MRCVVTPTVMSTLDVAIDLAAATPRPPRLTLGHRLSAVERSPDLSAVHGDHAEVDAGPHRRHREARQLVGRRWAMIGSAAVAPATSCHRSRTEVCVPVPMLTTQPTPAVAGADQRIDGVVDEHEVACLAAVAGDRAARPRSAAAAANAATTPPSGRWRGPYTVDMRQHRELDRVLLAVRGQQVDDRSGDDASHATRFERHAP